MELQHLVAKIPVDGALGIDPARVVDVFHQWVAAQSVPGVLLIDVAELLHVPNGPGVIAVGVEADYALDHTGGIWGVLYRRKTVLPGPNAERIAQAIESAAQTGVRLQEAFPGALKLSRFEFELIVNDRGIAPNTPATYAAAVPRSKRPCVVLGHGEFTLTPTTANPAAFWRRKIGQTVRSGRPHRALTDTGPLVPGRLKEGGPPPLSGPPIALLLPPPPLSGGESRELHS